MTTTGIVLTVLSVAFFTALVLLGAWIDGRRQALRQRGLHPVTTPEGNVVAQESQHGIEHDTAPEDIH